jgi:hypothetical protein
MLRHAAFELALVGVATQPPNAARDLPELIDQLAVPI